MTYVKYLSFATAAAMMTCAANAADLPSKRAVVAPVIAPFSWTGFYAGAFAGADFSHTDFTNQSFNTGPLPAANIFAPPSVTVRPVNSHFSSTGFTGGLQAGYNYQIGSFVLGGEADVGFVGLRKNHVQSITPTAAQIAANPGLKLLGSQLTSNVDDAVLGTLRARIGFVPVDRLLLFTTGGLAIASYKNSASVRTFDPAVVVNGQPVLSTGLQGSKSTVSVGATLGGGAEYAFTNNLSAKLEYLYTWLPDQTVSLPTTGVTVRAFKYETSLQTVRIGLNYHF